MSNVVFIPDPAFVRAEKSIRKMIEDDCEIFSVTVVKNSMGQSLDFVIDSLVGSLFVDLQDYCKENDFSFKVYARDNNLVICISNF